ncbi:DUF4279 domain-containing protein [Hymenobacter sp. BT186]|uniref:DUF4279 domain-containing protein n=1 Tax=Hymenobacter telluris TaxID=2816474 RepID=A0A939JFU3_9BACT|nr:DUF4279 domain-containing protein [Hymenobacter telluris]MBW3376821.1 DUF4279 domain-containing protein [Hymenobacter norwichensis]
MTRTLGIEPTNAWRIGDKGKYVPGMKFSCWEWSTEKGKEHVLIDDLVDEVLSKLEGKEELIVALKQQLGLESVLEIVLDIDINEEKTTPALGHDLRTINFLYRTQTYTDVDIYRYDSREKE